MTTIILKSLDINQPNWLGEIKSDEEFVFSPGIIYLKVKLRDDLVPENNTGEIKMEALFIEIIKERSKDIIVGTIYRPPNRLNEFDNDLKTILTKLDKWDKPCYTDHGRL